MNIMKDCLIGEVLAPQGLNNALDQNTDILDMMNYDGVVFIAIIEDSETSGVATLKVEQSIVNSDGGMTAITNATTSKACASGDDINNMLLIVDVYRPTKRYVQGVLTTALGRIAFTNTIAIRYKGRKVPITADSTVGGSASVVGS